MTATVMSMDPFELSATGILGDKRDTMLQNQLLHRNELGRPMHRGYHGGYPGEVFRYGRPNGIKEGGASDAMRDYWSMNTLPLTRRGGSDAQAKTDRDFMSLNRAAVVSGLVTASENYMFRATHDVRRKVQSEQGKKTMSRRLPPSMVFGISTRPSTPVHDLLEHRYQDQWLSERRNTEMAKRQMEDTKKLSPGKVYETRASLLRVHQVPVEQAPLWQMPRFSAKALPHLETFRTEGQKEAAFSKHMSDGISRKGVVGRHGIYEQAQS